MAPITTSLATINVAPEYGYVVLAATLTLFNGAWHGARIGGFRKAARLTYPIHYADSAHLAAAATPASKQAMHQFNCAQRGHGNFLEHQGGMLAALLIAGLRYPVLAAVSGVVWNVGRVIYALGYTDGKSPNGRGRLLGSFFIPAELVLFFAAGSVGAGLLGWF